MAEKLIKFVRPSAPYTIDDVACFNSKLADKFIELGLAQEVKTDDADSSTKDDNADSGTKSK